MESNYQRILYDVKLEDVEKVEFCYSDADYARKMNEAADNNDHNHIYVVDHSGEKHGGILMNDFYRTFALYKCPRLSEYQFRYGILPANEYFSSTKSGVVKWDIYLFYFKNKGDMISNVNFSAHKIMSFDNEQKAMDMMKLFNLIGSHTHLDLYVHNLIMSWWDGNINLHDMIIGVLSAYGYKDSMELQKLNSIILTMPCDIFTSCYKPRDIFKYVSNFIYAKIDTYPVVPAEYPDGGNKSFINFDIKHTGSIEYHMYFELLKKLTKILQNILDAPIQSIRNFITEEEFMTYHYKIMETIRLTMVDCIRLEYVVTHRK